MGSLFDRLSFELIEEIVRFAVAGLNFDRPALQRLQRVCRSFVGPCRYDSDFRFSSSLRC